MKSLSIIFLSIVTLGNLPAQSLKTLHNVDDSKIALSGYSPVSYVDLALAQRGNKAYKATYKDLTYYFTSAEQKAKFDKDPGKYLPQYGGFCAFGVYAGAKFRTDPHKFLVIDKKLYLFLNDVELDAKQLWLEKEEKQLISVANANWKKLKNQY